MSQFEQEFQAALQELEAARAPLLARARTLDAAELARMKRGGWTVAHVLQHIIEGEQHYAILVARLRSLEPPEAGATSGEPATGEEAAAALGRSRAALLAALDGVDEATYYDLQRLGREEYSVVSVLENVVHHDGEHLAQIEQILAAR